MNAQHKVYDIEAIVATKDGGCLHDGDAVSMFSSGLACAGSDALMGDATQMFSSGLAPVARGDVTAGEGTQMFSSGLAPVARGDVTAGEGTQMFSSGLARTKG